MAVFSSPDFDNHEEVVFCRDAATGLNAIIAVHDTTLGAGLGGCRFWPYAGEQEALTDALRLSRGGGLESAGSHGSLSSLGESTAGSGGGPTSVAELPLDFELAEFGNNLSVGERQLLCLARAIARRSRLVLLDEATANVDQQTDRNIQKVLNDGALSDGTRITIAHRLGTIATCDKVLVLDKGALVELDAPSKLLEDAGGVFYGMCEAAGTRAQLAAAARKADAKRAANKRD